MCNPVTNRVTDPVTNPFVTLPPTRPDPTHKELVVLHTAYLTVARPAALWITPALPSPTTDAKSESHVHGWGPR